MIGVVPEAYDALALASADKIVGMYITRVSDKEDLFHVRKRMREEQIAPPSRELLRTIRGDISVICGHPILAHVCMVASGA
jgi:hypothetical protein